MRAKLILPLLMLICFSWLGAQGLSQQLENADELSIGDRFQLSIKAPFALNRVIVPDTLTNFVVLNTERVNEPGAPAWFKMTITPILPGYHTFPSLKVEPVKPDGNVYATDRFRINVIPVRAESDTVLVDLKAPRRYPWQVPIWIYGLLVLVSLLSFAAYLWLGRKHLQKTEPIPKIKTPEAPVPDWQVALNDLKDLISRGYIQQGQFVRHYYLLSFILRSFMQRRFRIAALEMTTSEIRHALDKTLPERRHEVLQFLRFCDTAKFAKYVPSPEEVTMQHVWLEDFLLSFRPAAQPNPSVQDTGEDDAAHS